GLGLDAAECPQFDRSLWPALRALFQEIFSKKQLNEWMDIFEGTDACVTAVNSLEDAPLDAHLRDRRVYIDIDGMIQAAPAPRFSRTPGRVAMYPLERGQHSDLRRALTERLQGNPAAIWADEF